MEFDDSKFVNPLRDVYGCIQTGKLSVANRMYIVRSIEEENSTAAQWEKDLHEISPVKRKTINQWVYSVRKGNGMSETRGRPSLCGQEERTFIRRETRSHQGTNGVVEVAEMNQIMTVAATRAYNKRHYQPVNAINDLSVNSLKKMRKFSNVLTARAEVGTKARIEAEGDIRSAISLAAACHFMLPQTCYDLMFNADATQFQVGSTTDNVPCAFVADSDADNAVEYSQCNRPRTLKVEPNKKNGGITAYFVKYYCICNASGMLAPPIYIIADERMNKMSFDAHVVNGIGLHGLEPGFIVFMSTRVPEAPFYLWMFKEVLIPWMERIREEKNISSTSLGWFQQDGEVQQITMYENEEMQTFCMEKKIVVSKSSASRTAVEQPCDAGNMFKGTKTTLKNLSDLDVRTMQYEQRNVQDAYVAHELAYHGGDKMKAAHRSMGIKGILRIVKALRSSLKEKDVIKSFEKVGMRSANVHVNHGYDLDTILNNCTTFVTKELRKALRQRIVSKLSRVMALQGELSEDNFDHFPEIPQSAVKRDVNRRTQHKRYVFLTHCDYMKHQQKRADDEEERKRIEAEEKARKREDSAAKKKELDEKREKRQAEKNAVREHLLNLKKN